MLRNSSILTAVLLLGIATAGIALRAQSPQQAAEGEPSQRAVERTRKTVRMLDDIYKATIVLITDKYVNDESDYPAGTAAIDLFGEIEKKGWHKVRLIDLTGDPYDAENVAKDEFEKEAARQLKSGKAYHEQIVQQEGKLYLRAMTPVPVVMQKCIMCHPHYEDAEPGEAIGAVSYVVPIE